MQWAYYTNLRRLEPFIKEAEDPEYLRLWRHFQTSDHLYYMFTAGGGPGEVHSYFSPYKSAVDAFVTAQSSILDFENRVRTTILTANEPFLFHTDVGKEFFTGVMAWSLRGFAKAIQSVEEKSVEFHNCRGDFESWAEYSLCDQVLAQQLRTIKISKKKGKLLRKALAQTVQRRFVKLNEQVEKALMLF
jgi:alpha-amylase